MPIDDDDPDPDSIKKMITDYSGTLERLADLPEKEYQFLVDVYIHKRALSTITKKNPGITTNEKVRERTDEILREVLSDDEY